MVLSDSESEEETNELVLIPGQNGGDRINILSYAEQKDIAKGSTSGQHYDVVIATRTTAQRRYEFHDCSGVITAVHAGTATLTVDQILQHPFTLPRRPLKLDPLVLVSVRVAGAQSALAAAESLRAQRQLKRGPCPFNERTWAEVAMDPTLWRQLQIDFREMLQLRVVLSWEHPDVPPMPSPAAESETAIARRELAGNIAVFISATQQLLATQREATLPEAHYALGARYVDRAVRLTLRECKASYSLYEKAVTDTRRREAFIQARKTQWSRPPPPAVSAGWRRPASREGENTRALSRPAGVVHSVPSVGRRACRSEPCEARPPAQGTSGRSGSGVAARSDRRAGRGSQDRRTRRGQLALVTHRQRTSIDEPPRPTPLPAPRSAVLARQDAEGTGQVARCHRAPPRQNCTTVAGTSRFLRHVGSTVGSRSANRGRGSRRRANRQGGVHQRSDGDGPHSDGQIHVCPDDRQAGTPCFDELWEAVIAPTMAPPLGFLTSLSEMNDFSTPLTAGCRAAESQRTLGVRGFTWVSHDYRPSVEGELRELGFGVRGEEQFLLEQLVRSVDRFGRRWKTGGPVHRATRCVATRTPLASHAPGCTVASVDRGRGCVRGTIPGDLTQTAGVMTQPAFPHRPPRQWLPGEFYPEYDEDWDEEEIEILEPVSGGALCVTTRRKGEKRKLNPAQRNSDLELARTTTNVIDQEALARDSPELREAYRIINEIEAFVELFDDNAAWQEEKLPLSRDMRKHAPALTSYDIAERLRWNTGCPTHGPAWWAYWKVWIQLFLVPKKDNTGRLIGDCRPINSLQRRPPDMKLPHMHNVIKKVLAYDYAAKCDGVSYFYQFVLGEAIRPFFKTRLAARRGEIYELALKRLPMGWKYSPFLAQITSNFLVKDVGSAWLDDFIIGGGSMSEFHANADEFRGRLTKYNVEVDDASLQPSTKSTALGLEFDLVQKKFRLSMKWVTKQQDTWNALLQKEAPTFRDWYETFGALIWASYVRRRPMWMHPEAMAAVSNTMKSCKGNYDDVHHLPEYAVGDLRAWMANVLENEWMPPPEEHAPRDHFIFSDASSTGGAFIEVVGREIIRGEAWARTDGAHIFLGELEALVRGAQADPDPRRAVFGTDNMALHYCLKKGHSSSYAANTMLRSVFGESRPVSRWIPTHLMPADKESRGRPMMPTPCAITEEAALAVQYMVDAEGDLRTRSEPFAPPN